MRKLSKEIWILLAVLVLGFLVRLAFAFISNVPWWGESVYLNLGYDLSKNPLDYSVENNGWSDFIPSEEMKIMHGQKWVLGHLYFLIF